MNKLHLLTCAIFLPFFSLNASGQLERSLPEDQGVSSEDLRKVSEWVRSEELDIRSMILLRNGVCVFEWYAGEVTRDHNHNIFSITKSVVATLAGIALQEGKLKSAEVKLGDFLNGVDDPEVKQISLVNLMTMRSGFPISRGNRPGPQKDLFARWHNSPDRMKLIEDLELKTKPGREFAYNNIDPQVALSMIESAYDERALRLAREKLFEPLGFEKAEWVFADKKGNLPGGYGIRLRAIDLAKLGQLYLDGGVWNGERLLPGDFVTAATTDQTDRGYGYYWWIPARQQFAARGVRGQQIWIDRNLKTVFVVTSDLDPVQVGGQIKSLNDRIRTACQAGSTPEAFDALNTELKKAAEYIPMHRKGLPRSRLPQHIRVPN